MIIDPDTIVKRNEGCKNNTIAHECFHWHKRTLTQKGWAQKELGTKGTDLFVSACLPEQFRIVASLKFWPGALVWLQTWPAVVK